MKKINTPAKLTLKLETVKTLKDRDLKDIIGGAHARPTTTVLHTGSC